MPINQGLMKRNPNLTLEQFSESWYEEHSAILVPYLLHSGVTYYAQVCHPPIFFFSPYSSLTLLQDLKYLIYP